MSTRGAPKYPICISGVGDSWPPNCTRFGRGDSISGENPGVLSPASPWRLPIQKPPCPTLSSSVPPRPVAAEILFRTSKGPQPARSGLSIHSLHLNFNLPCSVFYLRISRSGRVMGPINGVGPRNPRPPSQHLSPFLLLCCFFLEILGDTDPLLQACLSHMAF
jgi:hypothetical protein